jgi:hypothetical protein
MIMSIYKRQQLIDNPVPDHKEREMLGCFTGIPYVIKGGPLRKIVKFDERSTGHSRDSILCRDVWVEVLECGHDAKVWTRMPDQKPPVILLSKRRRCYWCTESGQAEIKQKMKEASGE